MTPALKAMVEAMVAELNRQGALFDGSDVNSVLVATGEGVDLEKVARAGVAAIPFKSNALASAVGRAMEREGLRNITIGSTWEVQEVMISEILKEAP